MAKRKPRMTATERAMWRHRFLSDETRVAIATDRNMCPEHLRHMPCFKCEGE